VVEDQNAGRLQIYNSNNVPYDRWIMNWLFETNLAMPCFDLAVSHLLHRMSSGPHQLQEQEQLSSLCIALLQKRQLLAVEQGRMDLDFVRLMYQDFRYVILPYTVESRDTLHCPATANTLSLGPSMVPG
jgi:hypothetical protein